MRHAPPSPNLDYIRKLYAAQDSLLSSINETLHRLGKEIQISPEEGKLLQMLMSLYQVESVVEIGTLAGYSAIWMARALPPTGHLYAIEKDLDHSAMAQHFFDQSDVKGRISLLTGDAHQMLAALEEKTPFDMVFIDADKESYNDYLDWAEKHVRPYGLVVADNTLLFDTIALDVPPADMPRATWEGMRRFNDRLADPDRYFSTMVPTDDGLTVAIKLF